MARRNCERFEALGYKMVIWPVSALRIAAKAHGTFYQNLGEQDRADGMLRPSTCTASRPVRR
jgi:2-methylisocitrate lyase-like PEP mutase family enzyme